MIYYITNQLELSFKLNNNIISSTITDCLNWCKEQDIIEVDTETSGHFNFTSQILLLQLGNKENQYVIDITTVDISIFKPIFEGGDKLFLFQNAKFDLKFFIQYGIDINKMYIYDTMLAEAVITCGLSTEERVENSDVVDKNLGGLSLEFLALTYCNKQLDKEVRGLIHKGITNRVIEYSANDVTYLSDIRTLQLEKIVEQDLVDILNLENEFVKVLAIIEYNGMPFDPIVWDEVADKVIESKTAQEELLNNIITEQEKTNKKLSKYINRSIQLTMFDVKHKSQNPTTINFKSSAQKLEVIRNLGVVLEDTNDRSLQKIKKENIFVKELITFNKQSKLCDSFGKNFYNYINPTTNRIHPDYWQILVTGRMSCSEPNLLNIPSKGELAKKIRSAFVAREGFKIVGGDYSGMELCIIAQLSDDETWIKELAKENGDLHGLLAASTFNIPIENVRKSSHIKADLTYRDIQKTINFGLAYGMSEYKLSDTLEISIEDAKNIIDKFFTAVPKVHKFLHKIGKFGVDNGFILTPPPFNRRRYFADWEKIRRAGTNGTVNGKSVSSAIGTIKRASMNTPIQGCNGDLIKHALIELNKIIYNKYFNRVFIINSIYDEILTECEESLADEWLEVMKEQMIKSASLVITKFKVNVDIKITDFWQK